jgi:glycosyltransferase involved in cell wall biosynthesis
VIVNAASPVLLQHVQDSGVGMAYSSYQEFTAALETTLARGEAERALGALRGREYVEQRYAWPQIVKKFRRVIEMSVTRPVA